MRGSLLALVTSLGVAFAASAVMAAPAAPLPADQPAVVPAASTTAAKCPPGQRWVPPGYAKHGKYRVGKCVPK
jgi:hypothetical protein